MSLKDEHREADFLRVATAIFLWLMCHRKTVVVLILAMLVIVPATHWMSWEAGHKAGRVEMYDEVTTILGVTAQHNKRIGKYIFSKKNVYVESMEAQPIQRASGVCVNCHEKGTV